MNLSTLRVLNLPKRPVAAAVDACGREYPASGVEDCFALETCQRRILVTTSGRGAAAEAAPGEWLHGANAYCFLLEVASGLKSALVGECEIQAQLKSAWGDLERRGGALVAELRPWIQVVLADAKEVREQYLRGTGGQGYGSLLRHVLLEDHAREASAGPVLLVGAGKLAAGVLPYVAPSDGSPIRLCNRSTDTARALREHLQPRVHAPIELVGPTLEAELEAWRDAALVVLCVPLDPQRDPARVATALAAASGAAPARGPRVAHLGILEAAGSVWSELPKAVTLETLFAFDRRQAALRAERIAGAHRWCDSRARLRALDRCVSIAHGWEDLAGFAVAGAAC